ncbi:MAG: putative LPS assembly protein LptD [Saprospiraceae bacterium]
MGRFLFFLLFTSLLSAQDTVRIQQDSTQQNQDSLILKGTELYIVSKDSIDVPVKYDARDSIIFDMSNKFIYLYGGAHIQYQTIDLIADYISIDMNTSIVQANPLKDSLGMRTGIPKFKDGDQNFEAQSIRYNFKSKRGLVTEVVSKETDIFIHGEKSKFIAKDDSKNEDHIIYNEHGIFTTCDAPVPHFGIYSKRQKIIPNKLIVIGPSIVKIHGIPAPPLGLPFGFFPISKNKSSGLLFPKNYVYDQDLGFGLQDVGYYFPLSDYIDLKLLSSFWFKGSYKLNATSNYKLRYKYDGFISLDFADLKRELPESYLKTTTRTFAIDWSHRQLPGAHPYRSLGGRIKISVNPFDRLVYRDYHSVTNNTLFSNFNYSYNFQNSPFSLAAGFSHDQNINTRVINVSLPTVNLSMKSINPFKHPNKISQSENWYERITLNYSSRFVNKISTFDSILFKKESLDKLQYGFIHNASVDVNFKLLKYLNVVPQIRYDEEWFFKKQQLVFNSDTIFKTDTSGRVDTTYGIQERILDNGFASLRTMSASVAMNTQIYGQLLSKKGWFRGIRHVMAPSVSLNFAPNYRKDPFNYFSYVDTDSRPNYNQNQEYLKYYNSPFGTSTVPAENFNINFGVNNRVEMKYYARKDSSLHKLTLLDNLAINGNYNVMADSFKLSNISASGRMTYFKGITSVNFSMIFDPYSREIVNGLERRKDVYLYDTKQKLAKLTYANIGIASGLTIPQIIRLVKGKDLKTYDLPTFASLFETFSIYHQLQYSFVRNVRGVDSFYLAINSISSTGYFQLTPKWRITIGQIGYDLLNMRPTYPDFGFERDLHCWVMKFQYYPERKSFTFFIGVKPGSLEFIKIPSNQNFTGGF